MKPGSLFLARGFALYEVVVEDGLGDKISILDRTSEALE
jgi:hypothetical protein